MPKSKVTIIKETAEEYGNDVERRSVSREGDCVYETDDRKHCAFSRCCTREGIDLLANYANSGCGLSGALSRLQKDDRIAAHSPDALLKPEYQGHSTEFWSDVQDLHDDDSHWDSEGLTWKGDKKVASLLQQYGEQS